MVSLTRTSVILERKNSMVKMNNICRVRRNCELNYPIFFYNSNRFLKKTEKKPLMDIAALAVLN